MYEAVILCSDTVQSSPACLATSLADVAVTAIPDLTQLDLFLAGTVNVVAVIAVSFIDTY